MQPTRLSAAIFAAKATGLRLKRAWRNARERNVTKADRSQRYRDAPERGISVTQLWTQTTAAEFRLTAGKIENLRIACKAIDGVSVGPGDVFSFWQALGRPVKARGYTEGREIREGCVVPSIAGGLCQLSNALYDAALTAGLEIVERHAHTRVVPGSLAESGRDATVFWNYVDLRFRAPTGLRLEAELTAADLVVRIKVEKDATLAASPGSASEKPKMTLGAASCETCGVHSCFRHQDLHGDAGNKGRLAAKAAMLVDASTPEFARWLAAECGELAAEGLDAELLTPVNGEKRGKQNYAWPATGFCDVHEFLWASWKRSRAMRQLAAEGAARQREILAQDAALASAFAARLRPEMTHLVIAQNLLAPLYALGVLGGRTFDVLMMRLPLVRLQSALDRAATRFPDSPTLADFRAPTELVDAESKALSIARRLITPHAEIARAFPERAVLIPWSEVLNIKPTNPAPSGPTKEELAIVFPGPSAARKGAHAVRDAAKSLGLKVLVVSSERAAAPVEGAGFWTGVAVEFIPRDAQSVARALSRAIACVSPAIVEGAPRVVLASLAQGVPVIASKAVGLGDDLAVRYAPLLTLVPHDGEKPENAAPSAPHQSRCSEAVLAALRILIASPTHKRRAL